MIAGRVWIEEPDCRIELCRLGQCRIQPNLVAMLAHHPEEHVELLEILRIIDAFDKPPRDGKTLGMGQPARGRFSPADRVTNAPAHDARSMKLKVARHGTSVVQISNSGRITPPSARGARR